MSDVGEHSETYRILVKVFRGSGAPYSSAVLFAGMCGDHGFPAIWNGRVELANAGSELLDKELVFSFTADGGAGTVSLTDIAVGEAFGLSLLNRVDWPLVSPPSCVINSA